MSQSSPASTNRLVGCCALMISATALVLNLGCRSNYGWKQTVANDTTQMKAISARVDEPQVDIHFAALSS
ncbi:MAG: hypothetical protein O2856_09680, partial [Planctomycetota bacterium]|nr:hypothetical protein [Planctomycetota bacterium]